MTIEGTSLDAIKRAFEKESGLQELPYELREREGNSVLVLKVANPTERLFRILEQVRDRFGSEENGAPVVTLARKPGTNLLQGPEGKLLLKTLAESLNVNRYSFESDFLARYTMPVTGAEEQIIASANHVVFGRRGAGKSTLLLYALHTRNGSSRPSVWVDMQVYARRQDDGVISDVFAEIITQAERDLGGRPEYRETLAALRNPGSSEQAVRQRLPTLRRLLALFASQGKELFIFLDDFHVLGENLQPRLLDMLYAVCRGNKLYLKLSAIETLTRTYDPQNREGLEIQHDAQIVPLDYNLTMPDKATQHIEAILDSHAAYCGLPSIRRLSTSADVVPRLTWVAAGVPRDALSLFSQAITKAILADRPRVSVSNVNVAASETINTKLRELEADASGAAHPLRSLLEAIEDFCVKQQRRNAFLVEIRSDDVTYENVRKLVDLRLLHVINEGITIGAVGRKYLGLILDYGFYTGIRAARSVDLFNRQTGRVAYKDLRTLPVFEPER
jgi:hypothetical protein